jgi:hypothetical protein
MCVCVCVLAFIFPAFLFHDLYSGLKTNILKYDWIFSLLLPIYTVVRDVQLSWQRSLMVYLKFQLRAVDILHDYQTS